MGPFSAPARRPLASGAGLMKQGLVGWGPLRETMGSGRACQGFFSLPTLSRTGRCVPSSLLHTTCVSGTLPAPEDRQPTALPGWPGRIPVFCLWPWVTSLGLLLNSSHRAQDIPSRLPTAECRWHPACFLAQGHTGGHLGMNPSSGSHSAQ